MAKEPGQRYFEVLMDCEPGTTDEIWFGELPDKTRAAFAADERALLIQWKPCPKCQGNRWYEGRGYNGDLIEVDCRTCNGIGLVPREE